MTSIALRLNDLGLMRIELKSETALREARRAAERANLWMRGVLQEVAIGWFSGRYGLPAPAKLLGALARERETPAATTAPRAATLHISGEMQWEKTKHILAGATSGADAAGRLHTAASGQIDAASYALDRLMEEIGPLMIFTKEDEELEVRRYQRPAARRRAAEEPVREAPAHVAA